MHGCVDGDIGLATELRDIEQHTTSNDAGAPVVDTAKGGPLEGNFLVRVAAVPHALVVPRMPQGVEMRRRDAVVINANVVCREATRATRHDLHPVLRRIGVPWTGQFREVTAQGDTVSIPHQRRGFEALFWGDPVERPDLVVLAPAPPIPPFMQI